MKDLWPWVTLALLGAYHGINPGMGWLFAVSLGLQERSRKAVMRAFAPIAIGHFASIAAVVALVAALQFTVSPQILRYTGAAVLVGFGIYKLLAPMSHPRWVGMRVGTRQLALWSFLMATAHGAGLMVVPVVLRMDAGPAVVAVAEGSPVVQAHAAGKTDDGGRATDKADTAPSAMEGAAPSAPASPKCAECPAETQSSSVDRHPSAPSEMPACHQQIGKMAGKGGVGMLGAMAGVGLHTLAMFLVMGGIALLVYERIGLRILRTAWYNLDLVWAAALIGAGLVTVLL